MPHFIHECASEDDFWRARNFLREVFLLNRRLEHSWAVARLDYWRWHFISTCHVVASVGQGMAVCENADGNIIAALNHLGGGEFRLHIHPHFRSVDLENELLTYAEKTYYTISDDNTRNLCLPIFEDDTWRQEIAYSRGYRKQPGWGHHYYRNLDASVPDTAIPPGCVVRSMGGAEEYAARSWASWRAFHCDEPDENYDGDYAWYANMQSAPLYRRDLDIVAVLSDGSIAAFCTSFYDDHTRSAVTVVVGTAYEHWRHGFGKAVITEGLRRLKLMGCTRVFSTAHEEPADRLYRSVMHEMKVTETWTRSL